MRTLIRKPSALYKLIASTGDRLIGFLPYDRVQGKWRLIELSQLMEL